MAFLRADDFYPLNTLLECSKALTDMMYSRDYSLYNLNITDFHVAISFASYIS